jgi:hypothetical protein
MSFSELTEGDYKSIINSSGTVQISPEGDLHKREVVQYFDRLADAMVQRVRSGDVGLKK